MCDVPVGHLRWAERDKLPINLTEEEDPSGFSPFLLRDGQIQNSFLLLFFANIDIVVQFNEGNKMRNRIMY